MVITFHAGNEVPFQEYWVAGKKLEAYFHTGEDAGQAAITPTEARWVIKHLPQCVRIIKDGKKVIGVTFFFPTTHALMRQFLAKRLSEHTLWERTKRLIKQKKKTDCIYLASAFIDAPYRGKGIVSRAMKSSLEEYAKNAHSKHPLFFWGYSREGKGLATKTARSLRFTIHEKEVKPKRGAAKANKRKKPTARR